LKTMKCKAVRIEIDEREATGSVSARANEHLLACYSCRAYSDEHKSLLNLVGSLESVSAPPDFDWRLRARLAEERSERKHTPRWPTIFAPGPQAITVAASFALLLVGLLVYQQMKPAPKGGAVSAAAVARAEERAEPPAQKGKPAVPAANTGDYTKANGAAVGAEESGVKPSAATRASKNSKSNGKGTETTAAAAMQRVYSNDFGSRGAEEFATEALQNSSASAGPVISVPLRSSNPTTLRFEDEQGTKRSLAPVNFGGQEMAGRTDAARLVPASEKGIW
jgi:hypothetical protein